MIISDTTVGLEDVIIIATLAVPADPPQNFLFLEQPGFKFRGKETPLTALLRTAAYGGATRGSPAPDLAQYAVRRVSWTVKKKPEGTP